MSRTIIPEGVGFNVGQDFARASRDLPLEVTEMRGIYLLGFIDAWPDSRLGFMRRGDSRGRVYVAVQSRLVRVAP